MHSLSPALHRCKLFMHQPQSIKRHFLSFIIGHQQRAAQRRSAFKLRGATDAALLP
jgi:hypothetical protein